MRCFRATATIQRVGSLGDLTSITERKNGRGTRSISAKIRKVAAKSYSKTFYESYASNLIASETPGVVSS
jgi:hypothetical protein